MNDYFSIAHQRVQKNDFYAIFRIFYTSITFGIMKLRCNTKFLYHKNSVYGGIHSTFKYDVFSELADGLFGVLHFEQIISKN